jgi:hypothetical protein
MKRSPISRKVSPKRADIRIAPDKFTTSVAVPSRMKRRAKSKTKAERERMSAVAALSCVVCRNEGLGESPAELHHPRFLAGGGQRSSHMDVIGLCAMHHRLGGYGTAFHSGPDIWQQRFGTEQELLEQTRRELGLKEEE